MGVFGVRRLHGRLDISRWVFLLRGIESLTAMNALYLSIYCPIPMPTTGADVDFELVEYQSAPSLPILLSFGTVDPTVAILAEAI